MQGADSLSGWSVVPGTSRDAVSGAACRVLAVRGSCGLPAVVKRQLACTAGCIQLQAADCGLVRHALLDAH